MPVVQHSREHAAHILDPDIGQANLSQARGSAAKLGGKGAGIIGRKLPGERGVIEGKVKAAL
jgi:hypothetical protein